MNKIIMLLAPKLRNPDRIDNSNIEIEYTQSTLKMNEIRISQIDY